MKKTFFCCIVMSIFGGLFVGCGMMRTIPPCELVNLSENPLLSGSGTEEDPFRLFDAEDIYQMSLMQDGHFQLQNDIVLSQGSFDRGDGIIVSGIQTNEYPFQGVFDGNGFALIYDEVLPLFTTLRGAEIKNLILVFDSSARIENTILYESKYVCNFDSCSHPQYSAWTMEKGEEVSLGKTESKEFGLIALYSEAGSKISDITLLGNLDLTLTNETDDSDNTDFYVGLIVGKNYGTLENIQIEGTATIGLVNAYSSFSYDSVEFHIGALAGLNMGLVDSIRVSGQIQVSCSTDHIRCSLGGVVATNGSTLSRVSVDAEVTNVNKGGVLVPYGFAYTAGIAVINQTSGKLMNVEFRGHLHSESYDTNAMGGLVMDNDGTISNALAQMTYEFVEYWASYGNYYGGLIADGSTTRLTNAFYIQSDVNDPIQIYGPSTANDNVYFISDDFSKNLIDLGYFSSEYWFIGSDEIPCIRQNDDFWTGNRLNIYEEYLSRGE